MLGPNQPQCKGITKKGTPCKGWAVSGSDYCLTHDPERAAEVAAYRLQGGKGKSNEARARKRITKGGHDAQWLKTVIFDAIEDVKENKLDTKQAGAIAQLARVGFIALGATDFEQQLADMRRELAEVGESLTA